MNKQKITIIGLVVALFIVVQYLVFEKIVERGQQNMINAFDNGYTKGVRDSLTTIYQHTVNCRIAEISIENITRDVVDFSCLGNYTKNFQAP